MSRPPKVDYSLFVEKPDTLTAKYGLPAEVKYCKKCVISNQRPSATIELKHTSTSNKKTIGFNEKGVCSACQFAEQKINAIDWETRGLQLEELCDRFRRNDGRYDCIVPGSGGKDSVYTSLILKNKYNMHPLTVTWAPHIYTEWGWENFQSWLGSGFDNHLVTPNPKVHRLLTRLAVDNLFHPFQPFIIGQKALAAKMALLFDVPLVFYGESNAEYGSPQEKGSKRSSKFFTSIAKEEIYLGGVAYKDLVNEFGIEDYELRQYLPAPQAEIDDANIEVHNLGYYVKWHPQHCYYYSVENAGFKASPERTPGTYSKYNSIDDRMDDFHYFTTRIKFGIGRATYDAAQEIRSGDITREEGIALIQRYDHEFPERFAEEVYQYLSIPEKDFPTAHKMFEQPIMDREYFLQLADNFRSPHLWEYHNNTWKLRVPIENQPTDQQENAILWKGNIAQ
ncbi:N-acetyl sugar amidotransferase [Desulfocapsa sulfexigens]|uniref:N-acetyl sugar amidotransferase n=1 Tax=Desulfocapsa sulfexigens TaxID=65555 RepID=UPI0038994A82